MLSVVVKGKILRGYLYMKQKEKYKPDFEHGSEETFRNHVSECITFLRSVTYIVSMLQMKKHCCVCVININYAIDAIDAIET